MNENGERVLSNPEFAGGAKMENEAAKRAAAHPLPGSLTNAFCCGEIQVAGKTVYRVVPRTFQALTAIKSPLIEMIQDVVQSGQVDTELETKDIWQVCWIFTHEPKRVREVLSQGADALKEAAESEIGDAWDAASVNLVWTACLEQIKRHMATLVKFASEAQEKGEITFFRDSATPQETAVAGS